MTTSKVWIYRIAIIWALLFSANALVTALLGAIVNVDWSKLNPQAKLIIFMSVFVNWAGTMMAYFSQAARKLEDGKLPINGNADLRSPTDTTIVTKAEVTSVQNKTTE